MASPYLAEDESVVLATDNIVFRSEPLSALILTNKRILFIRAIGDDLLADEILHPQLRSAAAETPAGGDSVLLLSFVNEQRETVTERIAFPAAEGVMRAAECGEWAVKVREQIAPAFDEGTIIRIPPPAKEAAQEPVKEPEPEPVIEPVPPSVTAAFRQQPVAKAGKRAVSEGQEAAQPSQAEILAKHERLAGFSFPEISPDAVAAELAAPPPSRRIIAIAALAVFLLLVIAGAVIFSQFIRPQSQAPPMETLVVPATTPAPAATPSLARTPLPSPPPEITAVPATGVWARISYSGNYTGEIGEGSSLRPVSGVGGDLYQLAMKSGSIRAFVRKEDGSGNTLTVAVFRDGALVESGSTRVPYGEVIIQAILAAETAGPAANATATR